MINRNSPLIEILLATYNGEKYLREQLDSIINQEYQNWKVLIRDDGSSDGTLSVIDEYQMLYPSKFVLITDNHGRLGVAQSFFRLVQQCRSSYVAFCDQDDIWLPDKLQLQLDVMLATEKTAGLDCPVLLHSDLCVVDQSGEEIAKSFWAYQKYAPSKMSSIQTMLIQNHVTGCTMFANKALMDLLTVMPTDAIMHDWWLALVAVSNGKLVAINAATVMYRQHGSNDTGAKKWGFRFILQMISLGKEGLHQTLLKTRNQALALLNTIPSEDENKGVVSVYVDMFNMGWFRKRLTLLRHGFFKYGLMRNIAVFLSL